MHPYNNSRWKKLRLRQLRKEPLCEICKNNNKVVPGNSVDHIIPWTEENDFMYEEDNLQTLCASCHGYVTAIQNNIDLKGLTFQEAKVLKNSKIRREVNIDGYY